MKIKSSTFTPLSGTQMELLSEEYVQIKVPSSGGEIQLDLASYNENLWTQNKYIVADVYHESHNVLVVKFTFKQEGNKFISVHYGVLPFVKTRLCFPLKALNGEKLFLDRYPGVLQSVLRGDNKIEREKINGFSIETISSESGRTFKVSDVHLRMNEPEFVYEEKPYINELGQLINQSWNSKTSSIEELKNYLQGQLQLSQTQEASEGDIGRFGGWKKLKFSETGYFRTEFDGENWWLVDPEGYAMFSTGIDCIHPFDSMKSKGMEHLISWLPEEKGMYADAWNNHGFSYSVSNLIRVFGESWWEKWAQLTSFRLKKWNINTIGNWSQNRFIEYSKIPYVYPLENFPTTREKIYRDFPDVFSQEYEENADTFSKQLLSFKEDQLLVGYFMRNEPHWAFVDGLNLTEIMLTQPYPFASKKRFIEWLEEKYHTIVELNKAWRTNFTVFEDLLDDNNVEITQTSSQREDFKSFNRLLIRRYVEIPASYCKEIDPNHLNLGMRYAWIANEDMLEGCEAFDVFSINSYQLKPDAKQIEQISSKLNRPVMIGEFHFGAADVGMLAYGIRALATQADRGASYRYYVEQAATISGLIGVHYFQLNDQPVLGRYDGENYQIGLYDVCHRPYEDFVDQMKLAHERIYSIRTGQMKPYNNPPKEIPKTGF